MIVILVKCVKIMTVTNDKRQDNYNKGQLNVANHKVQHIMSLKGLSTPDIRSGLNCPAWKITSAWDCLLQHSPHYSADLTPNMVSIFLSELQSGMWSL